MPTIQNYRGIIPAIACPFTADHRIDEPALRKLASWLAGQRRRRRGDDQRPHRRGVLAHAARARAGHAHRRRRAARAPAGHLVDRLRRLRRRRRARAHGARGRRRGARRDAAAPLAALRLHAAPRRSTYFDAIHRAAPASTSSATSTRRGRARRTRRQLLAELARLPYVQAFKVGQRDMNKYARDIEAIRDADPSKVDPHLPRRVPARVDGAGRRRRARRASRPSSRASSSTCGRRSRRATSSARWQIQDVITPLKDAVYGGGEPTGEAHARMKAGMVPRRRARRTAPCARRPRRRRAARWTRCARPSRKPGLLQALNRAPTTTQGERHEAHPHSCASRSAALAALAVTGASAQAYPNRAGARDHSVPARRHARHARPRARAEARPSRWARPFVVENRPGGNGIIGADAVAKAPADGYTLLFNASTFVTAPMTMKQVPYDVEKDFAPIALVAKAPLSVAIAKDLPVTDVKSLIAYAKANRRQD